jgi:4-amino-4-deoxy-L-arabinose transferase-like glycosyltransferase
MMVGMLLLSILIPLAVAFCVVSSLWPTPRPLKSQLLLKLSLSIGIGFGIISSVYFLQLSLFGPSRKVLVIANAALLLLGLAVCFYRIRSRTGLEITGIEENSSRGNRFSLLLSVLVLLSLLTALAAFALISLRQPHGEWDAWAVYNMKARFLFRAGDNWRDIFTEPTGWTSPDYPLLVPAAIAACWTLIKRDAVVVPIIIALLFTFGTIGVVWRGVYILRGKTQGLLAALLLVCTPFLIAHGANQYTDVPLAFFIAATLVLLHLHERVEYGGNGFLILAGVMAGFSAWTKNEGLLFLTAIIVARLATIVPKSGWKTFVRDMRSFVWGGLPVAAVIIFFKLTLAKPNRMLFPPQGPTLIEKLLDTSRYFMILNAFFREGVGFGNWAVSLPPLLLFYLLLVGIDIKEQDRSTVAASVIALGIMIAGYFAVFVLSPLDVSTHLSTSANRVLLQLWPSFVAVFFLIVRTPEQALMSEGSKSLTVATER